MRHTIGALAALAALAVLGAAVVGGCGGATATGPDSPSPPAAPPGAADITGVVSDLTSGGDAGTATFLVVADPDVTSVYDRAWVRATAATTVWAPAGEARTELTVDDIADGLRVAVRFTGPVAESYPVQATAGDVEILTPIE
jgi:hypothetical protein